MQLETYHHHAGPASPTSPPLFPQDNAKHEASKATDHAQAAAHDAGKDIQGHAQNLADQVCMMVVALR